MNPYRLAHVVAGAVAVMAISLTAARVNGPPLVERLHDAAAAARDEVGGQGVDILFKTPEGWLTRHAVLSGGDGLSESVRADTARAVSAVPGVGGVSWRDPRPVAAKAETGEDASQSLHCQDDVEAILAARSIRFTEASARIDAASEKLLNEVAVALRPCVGSIIAVTGHTDADGDPTANLALSRARAEAVRWALIGRGIPADGLRAAGKGSQEPVEGLLPEDPANRRIEFSVIETMPLQPTPIDTPGPG